jgi:membrane protease YdiL (CAAX protease family)
MGTAASARRAQEPAARPVAQESVVRWRRVVVYTLLAYGIAWSFWASVMPEALHALVVWRTPKVYHGGDYAAFGMFAPAAAALIMRLFVSREGLRGSFGPLRRWRYLLIAVVLPIGLVLATVGISVAVGLGEFHTGTEKPFWFLLLVLLVVGTPVSAVLALGEEYGWRGYLLRELLPLGQVKASVIVALIWAPWHLPLLLVGLNYPDKDPLRVLIAMTVLGIGLSLLLTRLFVAAGGSVLVAALLHGSLNAYGDRLSDSRHLSGDPFVVSVGGAIGVAVLAVVVLVAYLWRRKTAVKGGDPQLI